jgi:hypothetical protein
MKAFTTILPSCLLLSFILLSPQKSMAQLTVIQGATMNLTPQQLVQNYLVGAGITVSNVTFNGTSTIITSDQVGTFATAGMAALQLGLDGGILMTSGKASIAIGPNNKGNAGQSVGGPGDPDLTTLSGSATFDKAVLEFDFIPQSDTVRFHYVFGSEEFYEFCNQYNDAFGFFLSGPGIMGTFSNNSINIARMPGTVNTPVTINNICSNSSSNWNNSGGQHYQYDGMTHVFTASAEVIPCSTYHIKLAIGDAVDKLYDSGVFLEQNSFSSPGIDMINLNSIPQLGNRAIESCNDVQINFRLAAPLDYPYQVNFAIEGSAINGVDYTLIDDFVIFPPGIDSVNVVIHPINDNLPEGPEKVILKLNQISCDGVVKRDTVVIDDYRPMSITPNHDTSLCYGGAVTLKASVAGGVWPVSYSWNMSASTDSIVTLVPPVGPNVYAVKVTDLCTRSVYDTAIVTVHPVPVANAGQGITIPNGTSTTLHGSAGGGYGNYSFAWTSNPPGFTSSQQNPSTGNISSTTIYILRVTDLTSGCQSPPAQVIIVVEGGALSTNPVADPDAVCLGDTAQLYSLTGGGSGIYSYSWSSTPAGFSSQEANPKVVPGVTTNYHLSVNDGFNTKTGSAHVNVYPLPVVQLGSADSGVCIYDTVVLDAGNPGSSYRWSNGATSRTITASTTGIGFDIQQYMVEVTNDKGCQSRDSINILFSFDFCLGVGEKQAEPAFIIYPNPASGHFIVQSRKPYQRMQLSISNAIGEFISRKSFGPGVSPGQEIKVDVSALSKGLYFILIQTEDHTGSYKLMIR